MATLHACHGASAPTRHAGLAALMLATLAPAAGQSLALAQPVGWSPTAPALAPAGEPLYLEVILNQVRTGQLAPVLRQPDGRLLTHVETLRVLGLRWPGPAPASGWLELDGAGGLRARYDDPAQRLYLDAPPAMLARAPTLIGPALPQPTLPDAASLLPALLLNYDLYGQRLRGGSSLSAWSELRLTGVGPGVWSQGLAARSQHGQGQERYRQVRYDSRWQFDFPRAMVSLIAGDTTTSALSWTRAARIGGIRLTRQFSLQPYRSTAPLAAYASEAALPSTVDLYINGIRQSSQPIQPGRFELSAIPMLNGSGQAQVVVTDVNGQVRTVDLPLYGASSLLQAGLTDWSAEVGALRRHYGLRSNDYAGRPMFSTTLRHGLSRRVTLEAHAEAAGNVRQGGLGGAWLLGRQAGVLGAALAGSQGGGSGLQGMLNYQWSGPGFSLSAGTRRASAGYGDVASRYSASALARRTDQVFTGFAAGALGHVGLGYVRQTHDGSRSRYASATWSKNLGPTVYLGASVQRSLGHGHATQAWVYLSWSPRPRSTVSATARHDGSGSSLGLSASQSPAGDRDAWGWSVRAERGPANTSAQAQLSRLHPSGAWRAGLYHLDGSAGAGSSSQGYASANGGLILTRGGAWAMRQADDAFALVSTNGVADVPVKLENRLVGQTDGQGLLFVSRLNAWQRNRLSIDPQALAIDLRVDTHELQAVPPGRGGVLATFAVRPLLAATFALQDGQGRWLPAGSAAYLLRDAPARAAVAQPPAPTVVGHEGSVYLEDPRPGDRLRVQTPAGATCIADLPQAPQDRGLLDLGTVACLPDPTSEEGQRRP